MVGSLLLSLLLLFEVVFEDSIFELEGLRVVEEEEEEAAA